MMLLYPAHTPLTSTALKDVNLTHQQVLPVVEIFEMRNSSTEDNDMRDSTWKPGTQSRPRIMIMRMDMNLCFLPDTLTYSLHSIEREGGVQPISLIEADGIKFSHSLEQFFIVFHRSADG